MNKITIIIIGTTGSGKTTLGFLITGFLFVLGFKVQFEDINEISPLQMKFIGENKDELIEKISSQNEIIVKTHQLKKEF